MTESLTTLQELVLDRVAHRHEAVEDMEFEVRLLLGNGVSRAQMTRALQGLRDAGLVDAFVYREAEQDYRRYRRPRLKAGVRLWWLATDAGRRALTGA